MEAMLADTVADRFSGCPGTANVGCGTKEAKQRYQLPMSRYLPQDVK